MGQAFTMFYWKEKNPWQTKIDRLASGKISWEEFFNEPLAPQHPGLEVTTTEGGNTLLHLAVAQGRSEWALKLKQMQAKRNSYGLTAEELGNLLGQGQAKLLKDVENLTVENPEKMKPFQYLENPVFENPDDLELILERTAKAKSKDLIAPEKIWLGVYFNKETQKGQVPKLTLKYINDQIGFGVFAAQKIPSCTFIGEYTGIIKPGKPAKDNYYSVRYTTWELGRKSYMIDAEKAGNFTRFLNHSTDPNLGLQSIYWRGLPRMILVSLKEIEEGAQLTFDYGNLFWKECLLAPLPIG